MSDVCPCSGISPCGDWLSNMVSGIWENTDQMAGNSIAFVSGWVLSPQNIGKLNNLIDGDYQLVCLTGSGAAITGYEISPCMEEGVQGIYSKLREYEFYLQQARWSMSGVGGSSASSAWTNIKEWNRSISQVNRIDVTRQFRELAKEAREDLEMMVKMWLKYHAIPGSVEGSDVVAGWGPYGGFGGSYGRAWGPNNPRNFPGGSPPYGYY